MRRSSDQIYSGSSLLIEIGEDLRTRIEIRGMKSGLPPAIYLNLLRQHFAVSEGNGQALVKVIDYRLSFIAYYFPLPFNSTQKCNRTPRFLSCCWFNEGNSSLESIYLENFPQNYYISSLNDIIVIVLGKLLQ